MASGAECPLEAHISGTMITQQSTEDQLGRFSSWDWYLATKRISTLVEARSVRPVGEQRGWIGQVHRRTDVALDTASRRARRPSCEEWYSGIVRSCPRNCRNRFSALQ